MTRKIYPPSDLAYDQFETSIGPLTIAADADGLRYVMFAESRHRPVAGPQWRHDAAALREPRQQLLAYFAGDLIHFDLPLSVQGTDFQQRAWAALRDIPYGETRSYSDQATAIGSPRAVRAIGLANGRNPLPIIVPCHRVIGRNGSLTGFGGGLECKRWLLDWEAKRSRT